MRDRREFVYQGTASAVPLAACKARALAPGKQPAAAKAPVVARLTARLKSCPDTRLSFGSRSGQEALEFALLYGGVVLPLIFLLIFMAEALWVWHSVVDFTREGARYAATHCWEGDGSNVIAYMQSHVPPMVDMDQFQGGAGLTVEYFSIDPSSGAMNTFECDGGDCSADCVPDSVTVSVTNYQFSRMAAFFKMPAITMPDFRTTVPIESAGCDESGSCLP